MGEKNPLLALIVAMDENGLIGKEGNLPWGTFKADLKRFKDLTEHHILIVGRKTHESILRRLKGKALSNRKTIVVTRAFATLYLPPDCYGASDPETALYLAKVLQQGDESQEVFVAGGAEIYRIFLPQVARMYITKIHAAFDGDTYFPHFPMDDWVCTHYETHLNDEDIRAKYTFMALERKEISNATVS